MSSPCKSLFTEYSSLPVWSIYTVTLLVMLSVTTRRAAVHHSLGLTVDLDTAHEASHYPGADRLLKSWELEALEHLRPLLIRERRSRTAGSEGAHAAGFLSNQVLAGQHNKVDVDVLGVLGWYQLINQVQPFFCYKLSLLNQPLKIQNWSISNKHTYRTWAHIFPNVCAHLLCSLQDYQKAQVDHPDTGTLSLPDCRGQQMA